MTSINPFNINGYAGPELFCDRVQETERLISLLENGHNVVLSAPRRIGKTDLISHVFAQERIQENFLTVKVDVYATQSFAEFVAAFGKAIIDALRPKGKALMDKFINMLASLKSEISFDINGQPVWGLGLGQVKLPDTTLDEIFSYLNSSEKPIVVAIDEFQQITKYSDSWRVEATLRTYIQQCQTARFIFAGSQQHLMAEIFASPARPFYASTTLMSLQPLDRAVYADFCQRLFAEAGRELADGVAESVYDRFDGITAYMHRVMNELFSVTERGAVCTADDVDEAIATIIRNASDAYTVLFYQMSEKQRELLRAVASEGNARAISSGAFVKKYGLHSASSVLSAAKLLLEKDILTRNRDAYSLYDKFFELWLRQAQV